MKVLNKFAVLGVTASLLAGGAMLAAPAYADPVTNGYVATGSDTLQDVMNALANGTTITGATVRATAAGNNFGSFDAFGSSTVQVKANGPYFTRPAGSGAGVTSLRASITGTAYGTTAAVITGQVDIARSSSGPGTDASTTGQLLYVPFARDAVAYAYKAADSASATVLSSLTTAQLTAIYSAATPTVISGVTINPRLPQSASGTRKFFLGAIAVSTVGAAVPTTDNTATGPAENDATILGSNQIIPFSVASWVAQSNGAAPSTIGTTGVLIGSPTGVAPFTGSGSALVANPAYYADLTWGRDTYLVVQNARLTSGDPLYDSKLAGLVTSLTSYGTFPSTPGAVKSKFGFQAPSTTATQRAFATL